MSKQLLLDTDILSAIMRKEKKVQEKARAYLFEHRILIFSVITKYEILRGLKSKDAYKQIERFNLFCDKCIILSIDDKIVTKAANIYSSLRKKGQLISDADIFISTTALVNGYGVVTNNYDHFSRIKGLYIQNWLQ